MKKKTRVLIILLLITFLFVFIFNPFSIYFGILFIMHDFDINFLKIDSCLEKGGSWNYEKCECEF